MTAPSSFIGRFSSAFLAIAGALPWLMLFLMYQLGQILMSQVGPMRTLGTMTLFALAGMGLALSAAAAAVLLRLERPEWRRIWRTGFFAGAIVNAVAVGLSIFYRAPAFAPGLVKGIAAVVPLALVIAYARYTDENQRVIGAALRLAGWGLIAVPLLAAPFVTAAALRDHPRLPGAPPPPEAEAARPGAPRRVVLVTYDGLRARSIAPINPQAKTPAFAALARQSTWYSQARAASDATLSSVTAILTGLPPQDVFPHLNNKTGFPRQGMFSGLAAYLAPAGYRSYYATMLARPQHFGLEDEFVRGRQAENIFPLNNEFNTAAYIPWERSLIWLRQKTIARDEAAMRLGGGPWGVANTVDAGLALLKDAPERTFLWLHLATPHAPLYPIDFSGPTPRVVPSPSYHFVQIGQSTPAEARRYEAMYEDYVRYADYELGRFLAGLEAAGLDRDTLLVVAADHGEEFVPGRLTHGSGHLSEDVTHVPLLIRRPGQTEGRRVDRLVTHIDIAPTILLEVYEKLPAGFSGRALQQEPPADRAVLSWGLSRRYFTSVATTEMVAAYRWPYKYEVAFLDGRRSLYDLVRDPAARRDIAAALPEVATEMEAIVRGKIPGLPPED